MKERRLDVKEQILEYHKKAELYLNAHLRCLGAIEALQKLTEEKEGLENSKK